MALRRAATVCLLFAAGCGSGEEQRRVVQVTPAPTASAAPRERDVIAAWADAVREGDFRAAARFFHLPAVVSQGIPLELSTIDQAETFNSGFPCGAKLEEVKQDGRFVVGTFVLTKRRGAECGDVGELVRVAFVFRGRRFSEWYQVPEGRGADPGPGRRPEVGGEREES